MNIILAEESDLEGCVRCFLASEVARRYGYTRDAILSQLRAVLAKGDLWVAKAEGEVLGYACIALGGAFSSDAYLRGIAVQEGRRSEGIGSQLLAFFEAKAFAISSRAFLLVGDYNVRAQAFYSSKGYHEVGRIPNFSKDGIAELIMLKRSVAATPNQSLEPTVLASTPRADARVAPAKTVAQH